MAETKDFPTSAVIGAITGRLLGDIGGIYEVLNWMTGESVFTHQLPRISREAQPVILAMYPDMASVVDEAKHVNAENWRQWLLTWEGRYGSTIAVPKFDADGHERIDPISELAEKMHPDRIAIVSRSEPILEGGEK